MLPGVATGERESFATFEILKQALFERFLPPCAHILYRDKLATLRQRTRPVEIYVGEFMALRHKCEDMTDGEALDRFMRGLDFRLRRQLCIFPGGLPTTLLQARERAILISQALQGAYFGGGTSSFGFNTFKSAGPAASTTPPPGFSYTNGLPEQMQLDNLQLRRNAAGFRGKCYECQQYGHRAFECPKKKQGNDEGQ